MEFDEKNSIFKLFRKIYLLKTVKKIKLIMTKILVCSVNSFQVTPYKILKFNY